MKPRKSVRRVVLKGRKGDKAVIVYGKRGRAVVDLPEGAVAFVEKKA